MDPAGAQSKTSRTHNLSLQPQKNNQCEGTCKTVVSQNRITTTIRYNYPHHHRHHH